MLFSGLSGLFGGHHGGFGGGFGGGETIINNYNDDGGYDDRGGYDSDNGDSGGDDYS
jgi:hypothetical protein